MTITKEYGNYTYSDKERGIKIVFKQFHAKHFDASAHVRVVVTAPGGVEYNLYKSRTGITTDAAQQKIASRVDRRMLGDDKRGKVGLQSVFGLGHPAVTNDWESTLSEACEAVLETYYAGTSPLNLYDDDTEEDDVWRIPGLLSEDTNLIYGQSGSGKSYLGLVWGQAIQHGVDICGLRTIKGNVCLIDYETTPAKMRRRLKRVDAGLGVTGQPMLYMPASVPLAVMLEPLQTYVTEHQIEFLIIDSLARASGGRITDEENIGLMFEALRQLALPNLIIHHTNRGDEYYGSPYIKANARNLWRLRSVQGDGTGRLSIQLQQEKENDGPGVGHLGFVMSFDGDPVDPDAVTLSPQDASMVPDLRKHASLSDQLMWYMEETRDHRIAHESIPTLLGLEKGRQETLRNYIWALKNNTNKYKKLAKLMHVDGDYLCLNTETGYAPSSNGHAPASDETMQPQGVVEKPLEEGWVTL